MKKQIFNISKSILILIFIYIAFSIIGGFVGEDILHFNLVDADLFRMILVSVSLLFYLYHVDSKKILSWKQNKNGFIFILLIIMLTLILNHDFTSFNYRNSYLLIAVATGLFEETMYRIIPFHLLDSFFKPSNKLDYWEIYLTTTVFALAHLYNIISNNQSVTQSMIQVIYAFCLGSVLAICYLRTHNVIFSILAHTISVLISEIIGGSGVTTQVSTTLWGWVLIIVLVVITVIINRFVISKKDVALINQ